VLSVATPGTVTKRLTDDEVQRELMQRHLDGFVTLDARSEFVFKHDESMVIRCVRSGQGKIVNPSVVELGEPDSVNRQRHVFMRCLEKFWCVLQEERRQDSWSTFSFEDTIKWETCLFAVDQRSVVGIARLCDELNSNHDIVAIYTQGINGDPRRKTAMAMEERFDFGGVRPTIRTPTRVRLPIRMGVDFIVYFALGPGGTCGITSRRLPIG